MKFLYLSILLILSIQAKSQIFGNTSVPDYGSYGQNQLVWLKVVTGPDDAGFFTHYGLYDHPTQGNTCEVKLSIYDQSPTSTNRPLNKLVEDFLASPTNGVWNEIPVDPPLAIEPNTTYWIGLRVPCLYGSGRHAGTVWANQPLRYYDSWSFLSSWPDPVSSSPSTFGNVNNVGLYLVGNNMTLPVELSAFDVKKEGKSPMLEWATSSEVNNAGWNIQRSENGFTWKTIGRVDGNENSSSDQEYSYKDEHAPFALVFYRLEQVDLDGQTAYSEVKSIDLYESTIKVYPTLVQDHITIEGIDKKSSYEIHSFNQENMQSGSVSNQEKVDLSHLPNGMYYITINGEAFKFVKT